MTPSMRSRFSIALLLLLSLFVTQSARAQDAKADPKPNANTDSNAPDTARTAMPDISGVWEHRPELREVVKENDGHGLMIDIPRGWLLIQKANEKSADFTVVSVAQPSAAKSPKNKKQPAEKLDATLSRLKWSAESKRFDLLSHDEAFGPMTIELLADGRLRVASKLDAAEQKNLATKKGIPEVLVKQVLNQIWNRVALDKLDEASRKQIAEMATSSGTTTKSKAADPLPREANPVPMMPDISGQWIFEVRAQLPEPASLREIIGNPVKFDVSRSRESEGVFEFMEKGTTRSPKMLVKWLPDTRRFRTVTSEAKPNGEATIELTADGKLLRMLTTLDLSEKKRLAKQFGVAEDALEQVLHQEFRRAEPSDVAAAPQDKPSNSKPLSPAEMLIQSGLGSFNPQAQPTDLTKPVQINLQPATQLAKLLVERFADRGAKVLEFEEGKRLKVEAPPTVLVQVGDLLSKVFQQPEQPAAAPLDKPLPQVEKNVLGQPTIKIPDISGVWAYETPGLPLKAKYDDGTEVLAAQVALTQRYLVQRATDASADFTFKDITIVALPGTDPQPLTKQDAKPERLKWNSQSKKFDMLQEGTASGTTMELLNNGRLKMTSNVSADERKRLAKEGGVSEATMEQLLHQTWVRVPLDKLDEATRKLVEAAPVGQPQPRHPVPHSDQQPRPGDWDRYFVVQRSTDQNETGAAERTKRFTVNVLPESPAIGFVKPGDRVDLYLPDFERLVVINANEVYVQPKRLIAASVPVVTFTEYLHGELRMTVLLTAAEESRIKSNPTWHDIAKMPITHVVRLKHASADHVVELLRQSFPFGVRDDDSAQNSLVSCESDLKQNAVILKEQPVFTEKPLSLIDVETAIRKLDAPVDGKVGEAKSVRALLDTPAAKQLVEQRSAEAGMPDITGTWGPYGIDEAIIRRTENGNADFEMSFQLRKQYVRQENDTDPPPLFLKWVPESQYFQTVDQTVDAVGRRRKTFSLKPHPDGKSMEVCSLQANPHPSDFFLMLKIKSDTQTSLATADDSQSGIYIEDFKLTNASADKLGQKLNVLFPNAMIAAYVRTNHIVAAADRKQLEFIGNVVNAEDADAEKVFSVTNGSAVEYAKILTALNPDLKVTADEQTNSIAVTADKERMKFVEALLLKLDHAATKPAQSKSDLNRGVSIHGAPIGLPGPPHLPYGVRALPDTPAAKQLVDQLTAQESAAAATAATIRQLQSNGQAEQNKAAIAEHQAKLKILLSTAFDLKLQLEELQVKELQSRLSRLERQIGQRKELREKIINRRAAELIEGDTLKWDTAGSDTARQSWAEAIQRNSTATEPAQSARSPMLRPAKATDEERIWQTLGLRLEPAPSANVKKATSKYQGGLTVLDVRNDSSAAKQGIRKDDILVGLHVWETASRENVMFVLNHQDLAKLMPLKFYVLRGEETLQGNLQFDVPHSRSNSDSFDAKSRRSVTIVEPEALLDGRCPLSEPLAVSEVLRVFEQQRGLKAGVITEVYEKDQDAVRVVVETIDDAYDKSDEPRDFPLVGEATCHRLRFRCVINFKQGEQRNWPAGMKLDRNHEATIYIDKEHFHRHEVAAVNSARNGTPLKTPKPESLPTPEELKAKLKPFDDQIKAARQRVRDLEPTFFKDRSNLKEMQLALQELAKARAAWSPHAKEIEAVFEELSTERELAELTAKALENRVTVMADKLARGEATEAEVRAAMAAHRKSPQTMADIEARSLNYSNVLGKLDALMLQEDDPVPPLTSRPKSAGPEPSFDRAFAIAWFETALQTKVEFVSLEGLDLPFKAAVRIREPYNGLQAGDLIVAFIGESFETLDQAVASSNAAKKRSSSDGGTCFVIRGGLSGPRVNGYHLDLGTREDCLNPTAPTSEWYRFEVKVRRGEAIEDESVTGTCVGPDGLVVIPIGANTLAPKEDIRIYNAPGVDIQVVGSDDRHGLTLLKLSGPLRQWVKCRTALPKLNQELSYFSGASRSNCVVTSIGAAYPRPLEGDDAFHIKQSEEGQTVNQGDKVVTKENELLGLVFEPFHDPDAKKSKYRSAVVVPAVHIQKLIDNYREKSLD